MSEVGSNRTVASDGFREKFEVLVSMVLEEWPQVSREELLETEGELDRVVELVATRTEHTKQLVRRQLAELDRLCESPETEPEIDRNANLSVDEVLERLERRTEKLLDRVKAEVLPEVKVQTKRHPVTSLLTAMGIGFILGLLFAGGGRNRR
ncbi:MAG: hypothetical protein J7641_10000 [Cyanobacteria bacterium SID2]|nr:hypothetical protein [Cyanobacteria bacterium SID2]MBP0002108.1 hypothetical protein [Cyanobacteria bacterium SBC]